MAIQGPFQLQGFYDKMPEAMRHGDMKEVDGQGVIGAGREAYVHSGSLETHQVLRSG